jgi:uncharacterized protein
MRIVLALFALLLAVPTQGVAQNAHVFVPATAEFPAFTGRVVDDAGVLDAATREALRARLQALEEKTGDQLIVVTVKSLHGDSVEDYSNRLFRHWHIGEKGRNNGVLLLHAPNERKVRIEVGYGLEGTLTDAISKLILANAVTPRFKANDFNGGMTRGVDDIIAVLSGDESFKRKTELKTEPSWHIPVFPAILFGLFGLFLLYFVVIGVLRLIYAVMVALGFAEPHPRRGFWHAVTRPWNRTRRASRSNASSSSSSSWVSSSTGSSFAASSASSSSGSSDSFSGGGGGDSGGGGASSDY